MAEILKDPVMFLSLVYIVGTPAFFFCLWMLAIYLENKGLLPKSEKRRNKQT